MAEETWSHDGGRSWELPQPGKLHEFNTPTGLWRMKNGWVVRLWNNSKNARRMPLAVAISKDNCRTWSEPANSRRIPGRQQVAGPGLLSQRRGGGRRIAGGGLVPRHPGRQMALGQRAI